MIIIIIIITMIILDIYCNALCTYNVKKRYVKINIQLTDVNGLHSQIKSLEIAIFPLCLK